MTDKSMGRGPKRPPQAFDLADPAKPEMAQTLEDELVTASSRANGDLEGLRRRLDHVQARIDRASLNSEEWNVLYRLRLQVEDRAGRRHAAS